MKFIFGFFAGIFLVPFIAWTQISISTDGSLPDSSSMLDVKSTTRGMLVPRMTDAQITAIGNPADGLLAYCTTDGKLYMFSASAGLWKELAFGTGTLGFTCNMSFTDSRDGKTYQTILIGTQCWMKQNLNHGTMIAGNLDQTDDSIVEKYCYNGLESNCDIYGGLYQWAEMVQYLNGAGNTGSWLPEPTGNIQGICPPDWHLPTDDEWTLFSQALGGDAVSGGPLKEAGYSHWVSPNYNATNSSNFTALPGGIRYTDGNYYTWTSEGYFWTATQAYPAVGTYTSLHTLTENLNRSTFDKANGFSVRCIHD